MVEMSSISSTGPSTTWPGVRSESRYAGVCCRPPCSKYAEASAADLGSGPVHGDDSLVHHVNGQQLMVAHGQTCKPAPVCSGTGQRQS